MMEKPVLIIDGICILLFVFMMIWTFALPNEMQEAWMPVALVINPFRTGAGVVGIGLLITCIWGEGRTGLAFGIIMMLCFLITAIVSLAGLMGVTSAKDLLWYLPQILIPIACVVVLVKRRPGAGT